MRRRLLIIAIFLLAGAAVNVGVAWGFVLWPGSWSDPFVDRWVAFGGPVSALRAGWPMRSMGAVWVDDPLLNPSHLGAVRFRRDGATHFDILALRPMSTGFAINTLFWAAVLWLVIPGPFALRRLIRRRRGLCPACGYDLRHGEHEACPECGVTT